MTQDINYGNTSNFMNKKKQLQSDEIVAAFFIIFILFFISHSPII